MTPSTLAAGPAGIDFLLLGDLDVRFGGTRWRPPSRKPRRLLAALLLDPGRYVPRDRLIDLVWDGDPPKSALNAIQVYVSQLRAALPDVPVSYRTDGYLLDVDPDAVDLHRFRALVARSSAIDPWGGADLLRHALGLFRGRPLADIGDGLLRSETEPVIVEERLAAWESLADLELRLDRCAELVPRLVQLTREHPLRERFYEQLMTAQSRQGRTSDASQTYRRAYRLLRDELGVEPGPGLRAAHRDVIEAGVALSPAAESARPNMLPRDLTDFVGREAELARAADIVGAESAGPVVLQITGMAGVGKTALATRLAHRHRADYPDGQLFIDLDGHTPDQEPVRAGDALELLLRMLGVPAAQIAADTALNAARWRAMLARRRMVIVLDNMADVHQVQPLLPGDSSSLVLLTGRTSSATVDGAHCVALDVLTNAEASALFTRIVGRPAVGGAKPISQVVRLCGHLPLAIRLAASRLRQRPTWQVQELVQRLDNRLRLDELAVGHRSVDRAFGASYRALPDLEQRVFRLLSLAPGPDIDVAAAAALAELPGSTVRAVLESLLDRNLIEQRRRHCFQMHDLVRLYSGKVSRAVDPEPYRHHALRRLLDHLGTRGAAALVGASVLRVSPLPGGRVSRRF